MSGDTGSGGSLRAYAKHRKAAGLAGGTLSAVQKAIESQRLRQSIDVGPPRRVTDFALADQEWAAWTLLTKAPTAAKLRPAPAPPPKAPAPAPRRPPSDEAPETDDDAPADDGTGSNYRDSEPGTLNLQDALAFEKDMRARLAELQFLEKSGELVNAKTVEARVADDYARCRTKLLGLARKAKAALPHLTHTDITTIDDLIREALQELGTPPANEPEAQAS